MLNTLLFLIVYILPATQYDLLSVANGCLFGKNTVFNHNLPNINIVTQNPVRINFTVQDNVYGASKEIKNKISQSFFTSKPTGQGTGLELSLAYDIVKTHGGEIKVEAKPTRAGAGGENGLYAGPARPIFTIVLPKNKTKT